MTALTTLLSESEEEEDDDEDFIRESRSGRSRQQKVRNQQPSGSTPHGKVGTLTGSLPVLAAMCVW